MSDIELLRLRERIDIALELGESHYREFKSALEGPSDKKKPREIRDVCKDIARTLVAFANADGGELLVGVEDDAKVTGIRHEDDKIQNLLNAVQTHIHPDTPLPTTRKAKLDYDGRLILYFSIPKGTEFVYLTSDGMCVKRKDRESIPVASEHIVLSRAEATSREYDREFSDNATVADLDLRLITVVAERISKGMSVEKCLQHLDLAEFDGTKLALRKAALLLFAKDPLRWHPRLQVRILKIDGTELKTGEKFNVINDEIASGNILNLIETSWDLLRPHLTETRFSKDAAIFSTQIRYPELACREALINAIAHRDYGIEGRGIEVRVYTDRLEIVNPGALLSTIKIDDIKKLKGVHESRNSYITRVLREVGYMRELGEGMRRIYELMYSSDLTPPEIISGNAEFSVTLQYKYVYSDKIRIWLESFEEFNLSRDQKTVIRLGYDNHIISPQEIWDAVGIEDTEYYRKLLQTLQEFGVLKGTMNKNAVSARAKKLGVSRKQIPRYQVIPPVKKHVSKPQEPLDRGDYAKVFVANVPNELSENDLANTLGIYGEIANVVIPINRDTGFSRGYAFVEFEKEQSAQLALAHSGEIVISGRRLWVQKYLEKK